MVSRNVLYVGRFGVPNDAAGIRVYNIANIFRNNGHVVSFVCNRFALTNKSVEEYDGFTYYFNQRRPFNKLQFMLNIIDLIFAWSFFAQVKRHCTQNKPDVVIVYNELYYLTKKILKYCKKKQIKLIVDVTEWYDTGQSGKITTKIVPYFVDKRIRKLDKKVNNIIAVSPFLDVYYKQLQCNSIFIPPIFKIPELVIQKYHYYHDYVINLVYAGSPGNKDILLPLLEALVKLNSDKVKFRLDIVGVDSTYLSHSWRNDHEKFAIFAHGRLSHQETIDIIKRADFGVLLRYNKRYAKAGFSTKFAECMVYGVAVICNPVGGADGLIEHQYNGMLIENVENLEQTLSKLLSMEEDQLISIKKNAFKTALQYFDREKYASMLDQFIS